MRFSFLKMLYNLSDKEVLVLKAYKLFSRAAKEVTAEQEEVGRIWQAHASFVESIHLAAGHDDYGVLETVLKNRRSFRTYVNYIKNSNALLFESQVQAGFSRVVGQNEQLLAQNEELLSQNREQIEITKSTQAELRCVRKDFETNKKELASVREALEKAEARGDVEAKKASLYFKVGIAATIFFAFAPMYLDKINITIKQPKTYIIVGASKAILPKEPKLEGDEEYYFYDPFRSRRKKNVKRSGNENEPELPQKKRENNVVLSTTL